MEAALFAISPKELEQLMCQKWQRKDIQHWIEGRTSLYFGTAWCFYHDSLNRYSAEPIPVLNYVVHGEHILESDLNLPEAIRYTSVAKVSAIYQALQHLSIDELKHRYQKCLDEYNERITEQDELSVGEFRLLYDQLVHFYRVAAITNQVLVSVFMQHIPPQRLF